MLYFSKWAIETRKYYEHVKNSSYLDVTPVLWICAWLFNELHYWFATSRLRLSTLRQISALSTEIGCRQTQNAARLMQNMYRRIALLSSALPWTSCLLPCWKIQEHTQLSGKEGYLCCGGCGAYCPLLSVRPPHWGCPISAWVGNWGGNGEEFSVLQWL